MDVFGEALKDYFYKRTSETLWLHNSYDEPEEMPVDIFFRKENEMPDLELMALDECRGSVLDIGAGVGSHALVLQKRGLNVTALDNSPSAVEIMKQRGVKRIIETDLLVALHEGKEGLQKIGRYDTLLFLMNGIGLTGTIPRFKEFLALAEELLLPGGQLLFDSSDIAYLYQEIGLPENQYYGEVSYQYEYKKQKGGWFNWLYMDQRTLARLAKDAGWQYELIHDDGEDQYLTRLMKSGL